jgi:hypothetical protein
MINNEANNRTVQPDHDDQLLDCPTCGLPAEITDRFTLDGVPEPVEHVKLMCIGRHWSTLPIDLLPVSPRVPSHAEGVAQTGG